MKTKVEEIIEKMPEDLSDIEKVRYMYLNCGDSFTYDRDYIYLGMNEKSKETYEKEFIWPDINNNESEERIKAICTQIVDGINSAINTMANKVKTDEKINARKVGYVDGEQYHVATLVDIGKDTYFLDLYKDLYRIQRGMKTKYFAPSESVLEQEKSKHKSLKEQLEGVDCKSLSDDEIMQMDKKCGYNKNGIYIEDAIKYLKEEMQDEENLKQYVNEDGTNREEAILKWKLDYICKYLINNKQENSLDINELQKYFIKLYYSILTEEEQRKNMLIPIDIHLDGEQSVLFNIYTSMGHMFYIYKGKDIGIERVSDEELKELRENHIKYDASDAR